MALPRLFAPSLILLGSSLFALACGSSSPSSPNGGGAQPGSDCSSEDGSKPAEDGCNTCTCSAGQWSCTEMDCNGGSCEDGQTKSDDCNTCTCSGGDWQCTTMACVSDCAEGDTKDAEDGCNSCSCSGGVWACTKRACLAPECSDGDTKEADDGCNTCSCTDGGWQCTLIGCPSVCEEGATSDDGCNTCTCSGGEWACSDRDCLTPVCTEGDTKEAEDGCNQCECSGGGWSCTERACAEASCGGLRGSSCASAEYCHYAAADICGAADATGICRVMPEICESSFIPVCGCDGETHSNACAANAAGTSVASEGECQAQ